MKIVKVIHGYPMLYNAGSEVYSQTICHELSSRHEVHVFTREENAFQPDHTLRVAKDIDKPEITLHMVNNPRYKDRYRATGVDEQFATVLDDVQPDIVHVGHLNHLSTSLVQKAVDREIPIVYTLHDYWLMCPRGQFMQMFPEDKSKIWTACDGQEDRKCAERCYARYFAGSEEDRETDIQYWTTWVARRMKHIREMVDLVDVFIAPARYLLNRYQTEFGIPKEKLIYLDYGFDRMRMANRQRVDGEPFTFGYIGTHIPAKGIHHLIEAFNQVRGAKLRIWGRARGQDTAALKRIGEGNPNIEWMAEYKNEDIVQDVLNHCDAIVVPSIWAENSPLVIHEAQQAKVPVITANTGGMSEYVYHHVNGLLFDPCSVESLREQLQFAVSNVEQMKQLGGRGYLYSEDGQIPAVEPHVEELEQIYQRVHHRKSVTKVQMGKAPWRITFDTNPDTCNLRCIMCEEHSPFSPLQKERRRAGRPKRLMPVEWIEQTVAEAVPHGLQEIIPSTMGEPLLYDDFEKIIDVCHRYGVKMNLTTNGTFPRLGATAWAQKVVPITSDVKISWNGSSKQTQERIMVGSNWEKVLQNLKDFIAVRDAHAATGRNRCRVTLQLTFLQDNVEELVDIVRLGISLGVDRIKGHHLWAHFDEIKEQSMRRSSASIQQWNRMVTEARQVAKENLLSNGEVILLENIFPLDENATNNIAPNGVCPFLGQEAWVSAEGRFNPCCAPDAQRRKLGGFGNLKDSNFMDLWQSKSYQDLTKRYRNHSLCLSCNMRKPESL
jgi:glycosyltransferase involved in cell wall biosynthesis/MoaA/NifB/PqqE/SkfB family radical SAM enzyme